MKNLIYSLSLIILFTVFVKCKDEQNIIPRDKFISLLVELHKTDALLNVKALYDNPEKSDTISHYNFILKKYNITRMDFEKTVLYYSNQPEEYLKIYDDVTNQLRADFANIPEEVDPLNLWKLEKSYKLPEQGSKETIAFSIVADSAGTYVLSANIRMFPDDGTVEPRMTILANYLDGTYDQQSNSAMQKDGVSHTYEIAITTNPDKELLSITGWILDHSDVLNSKHLEVSGIKLIYKRDIPKQ